MSLQIEQVRPLLNSGLSYTKAAKKLGVNRGAVAGVDWRAKNPAKVEAYKRARSGKTATREQMKAERKAFAKRCFPVLPGDCQILDLYVAGLGVSEIAAKMEVHKDTVRRRLVRMGEVHKSTAVTAAAVPGIEDEDDA
jgi:DNA invertase Pin-like site-specific DNA recombinase